MCDHSIYILYALSSKDSKRTLGKSSVRPAVKLSHAPKLFLVGLNSINPPETLRKCLGTEGFSQISRIPRAKRESPPNYTLYDCCMSACTMAFVLKEDPEGTSSSRKIFQLISLIYSYFFAYSEKSLPE